ncbi:MAG TPA: HAMP domain-containing sensor histidine kinase [Bryobacteraceae bacterium]|nr:HAMP domain-containing sensor histidine kinase [Bryobacteraceae bacterium]
MFRGMGLRHPRSSSTQILLLLRAVTIAVSVALCALAWRLIVSDRTIQQQRAWERLEHAADLGSSGLLQQVARTGEQLRAVLEISPAGREHALRELVRDARGSTALLIEDQTFRLIPNRPLRYRPDKGFEAPITDSVFAPGEALEYERHDYSAAARWFVQLANRSHGAVRAGALLRAARNEVRQKRVSAALGLYSELAALGTVRLEADPAELVGRYARLALLPERTRVGEAASLALDLESGRWTLSRASYEYYRDELAPMTAVQAALPLWEDSIEGVVSASRQAGIESGERVIWAGGSQPVLLMWRTQAGSVAALAVTGGHVEQEWLARVPGFVFGLETADGRRLVPLQASGKHAERILSFANAHWRLVASPTAPASPGRGAQALLFTGLTLVIVLVATGSYAVFRAVARELSVARLQTDFVSAVSHEFRTPLTTLRSMSEMLERGRVPTEERKQRYYELMARETARLHHLVEDLLDFGRMDAGAREYDLQRVEVAALVRQSIAEFHEEHATSTLRMSLNEHCAPQVMADPEALRRALHNLLDNAVKYSPEETEIQVAVRTVGDRVCISVEDRGMGVAPEDLQRIFRKFERGTAAKASSIRGTGLGLAMVDAIIRAHGGSITVESELHKGTTFTMALPSAATTEESVAWPAS